MSDVASFFLPLCSMADRLSHSGADAPLDERRTRHEIHVPLVRESPFQVAMGDAGMLAHDRFGAAALPPLDGREDAAMLVLRHGQDVMRFPASATAPAPGRSARRTAARSPVRAGAPGPGCRRHADQDVVEPRVQLHIARDVDLGRSRRTTSSMASRQSAAVADPRG